jgi:CheY-like chemotaxis protein
VDKRKILIADDNADDLSVLEKVLEQAGYEVITAHDGRDAFRLALENRPDLIILDVFMPEMSGGLVRLSLKEEAETREIPVIFLSCLFAEKEIAGQDIMFGDSPRLGKPCEMGKLLKAVEKALGAAAGLADRGKT